MQKTVGILTTLYNYDSAYSLVSVINDQLVAHIRHGYKTVLFVLPSFKDDDKVPAGVEIRKVIPQIILEPYGGLQVPDTWRDDVERIKSALQEHATDIDIMLTHDIVFIDTYLPYNIALREAELKARQFHWIHSAPSPRPQLEDNPHANRYSLPPNSKLVYLNNDKSLALAEMYGTWLKNVRVIYNSIDPRTFWKLDPIVMSAIDKYDILSSDIISVYPVSSTRMIDGKQLPVLIRIHAKLHQLGYKTTLIIPNAHCNAEREKQSVEDMLTLAESCGLPKHSVLFTSKEGFEMGVPRSVVSDFFRLSNVFIFPSISENCSLILLEAMLSGNLLVLNKDCSGFQEFGGSNALYFKMGNLDNGIRNEENALQNDNYYLDIAKIIKSEFEISKPLQAKRKVLKQFNFDAIFDKIEQMYYEGNN